MRWSTLAAVGLLAFVSRAALATAADEALALFGELDLPSVEGKRWVVFNTGRHREHEGKLRFAYASGWLVEERPNEVELLTRGLVRRRYARDRALPEGWDRTEQPANLPLPGEVADADFEALANGVASSAERYSGFDAMDHASQGGLSRHAEACLLAHWARQQKKDDLAAKLLETASRALGEHGKGSSLASAVAADLAVNVRWQAINQTNEGAPRTELLSRWKIVAALPTKERDEAKRMVAAYETQLAEDAAWKEPSQVELAKLPPAERAAVWIRRLRDHAARQWEQPGSVGVLGPWAALEKHKVNPADELARLGWDAVPALIEHLTDASPTRCMGFWRMFAPESFYLLTVGDCCQQVFEAVTDEPIYRRASTSGAMTKDGQALAAQQAARAWWDTVKAKGERAFLVEAVSSGERSGAVRADRLAERFPEAALAALRDGIARAKSDEVRAHLVSVLGALKEDATALLEAEAVEARPLVVRIAAVQALVRRGRHDALVPLFAAWDDTTGRDRCEQLLGLFVGSGDPRAIEALGRGYAARPVAVRRAIVESLGERGSGFTVGDVGSSARASEPGSAGRRTLWLAAVEGVLAGALDDDAVLTMSGTWDGKSFANPRIGDLAADALAGRFPDRYAFDLSGSVMARDRQRLAAKNVWRVAHGQPALEVPAPPPRPANPNEVVTVSLSRDSVALDESWKARLDALRGKPMDPKSIVELVCGRLPAGARGVRLAVERPADRSGVVVSIGFPASVNDPSGGLCGEGGKRLPSEDSAVHVSAGKEVLVSWSGSGRPGSFDSDRFREALEKALAAGPETPFSAQATRACYPGE